jgi:hypothetical protein
MLRDEILRRVQAHYSESEEPLLLSQFGKTLRVEGLWPVDSESRSLREVIESLKPDVDVVRDPTAVAYAIVVDKDHTHIAESAIKARHDIAFLRNLPRSVVIAFLTKKPDDAPVYLQTKSPFKYRVTAEPPSDEFILVDDEFRIGEIGVVEAITDLSQPNRERLSASIRGWASKHNMTLDRFYKRDTALVERNAPQKRDYIEASASGLSKGTTALERLQAAQTDDIRERIVIPLDIALILSRLP